MSQVIDSKIVEMRFDNQQFAKGISDTLAILDKFKQSLNFDGAVETVQAKFSAMDVVITTALANITNSAVNAGKQLAKSLSVDNISAGWEKFGEKTGSVATLVSQGYKLEDVEAQLERLNWYTDETSYNFTDMVSNIAKFTASGRGLEESVTAMEGIANWAALSGQNATKASQAMYQLSQAMGKGALKLDDFKSIQNVSMDTREFRQHCLDAAVAAGTLTKSVDGFYTVAANDEHSFDINGFTNYLTEDMWLTSDVMMKVFNEYSAAVGQIYDYAEEKGLTASEAIEELGDKVDTFGLKAFKAAQEARTWKDAIDSAKDALSTSFMHTFEIIFGNYEEATKIWTGLANTLYEVLVEPVNKFNEILKGTFLDQSQNFIEKLVDRTKLGINNRDEWSAFKKIIIDTAKAHGIAVDEMIKKNGSFEASLKEGWLSKDIINEVIGKLTKSETDAMTEGLTNLDDLRDAAMRTIRGDYGNNMEERLKAWAEEGFANPQQVQDYVNLIHKLTGGTWEVTDAILAEADAQIGNVETLAYLSDEQLKNMGYTEAEIKWLRKLAEQAEKTGTPINKLIEQINRPTGRDLFIDSIKNTFYALSSILGTVNKAWHSVFSVTTSEQLYNIIAGINKFTKSLIPSTETSNKLYVVFRSLANVLRLVRDVFVAVGKAAAPVLSKIAGGVLNVAATISKWVNRFVVWAENNGLIDKISKIASVAFNILGGAITWLIDHVGTLIDDFMKWAFVGGKASNAAKAFGKVIEWVTSHVSKAIEKIKQWSGENGVFAKFLASISDGSGKISLKKIGENIAKLFSKGITGLPKKIGEALFGKPDEVTGEMNGVLSGISKWITGNKVFKTLETAFTTLKANIKTIISKVFKLPGDGTNKELENVAKASFSLSNLFANADGTFPENALKGITNFLGKLKEVASNIDWPLISTILTGIATVFLAKSILNVFGVFKKIGSMIGSVTKAVTGIGDAIQTISKAYASKLKAEAFKERMAGIALIIASIALVAGAVFVLGNMPQNKLIQGMAAMIILGTVITLLMVVLKLLIGNEKLIIQAGGTILALGVSMLIMIKVLKDIDKLVVSGNRFYTNFTYLFDLMGLLVLSLIVVGKSGKQSLGGAATILAVALAVKMLVGVFKELVSITSGFTDDEAERVTTAFLLLVLGLAAVSVAAKGIKISNGAGLLAAVLAVKLLIGVLDDIAKIDTKKILNNISSFILVFAAVAALMAITKLAGKNALKGGIGILAISGALYLLVGVIFLLGKMKSGVALKGIIFLSMLMISIVALMKSTQKAGKYAIRGAVAIAIIVGALVLLTAVIYTLGKINGGDLAKAVAAISVLMGMFALLIGITKLAQSCIGTIIVLGVVVAGIAALLGVLATTCDAGKIDKIAKSMTLLIAAFSAMMAITKFASTSWQALVTIGVLGLIVAGIAGILYLLRDVNSDGMLEKAGSISLLLLALSASAVLISKAGGSWISGVKAAANVLEFVGIITLVFGAIAAVLWLIDEKLAGGKVGEALDKAAEYIEKLGNLMGAFIKGAFGGLFGSGSEGESKTSFFDTLPSIGTKLSEFMTNLQPFIDGMVSAAQSGAFAAAGDLAKMILTITGAELLDSLAGFIGGGETQFASFIEKLPSLGEALTDYADSLGDSLLNEDKINASENLAKMLASLMGSQDLRRGGLYQAIIGDSIGLLNFALQLPGLAVCLSDYAQTINETDFNETKIKTSENMVKFFATIYGAEDLKEGGLLGKLMGGSIGLDTLGGQLEELATGLKKYSDKIDDATFNSKKIKASKSLVKFLATLYGSEELKTGGVIGFIFGDGASIGLNTFGTQITSLATGLSNYANKISEATFNKKKIKASKKLVEMLKTLCTDDIPEGRGVLGWLKIGGYEYIGNFSNELPKLGNGLSSFANSMNETTITAAQIRTTRRLAKMLTSLCSDEIPEGRGVLKWLFDDGYEYIGLFSEQLPELGKGMASFANSMSDTTITQDQVNTVDSMSQMLTKLAVELPSTGGILGWLSGSDSNITNFAAQLPTLGTALKEYVANLGSDMNAEKIETAGKAALMLADLQTAAAGADYGGLISNGTLENFGSAIATFGKKLGEFASVEIDTEKLASMADASSTLALMARWMKGVDNNAITALGDTLDVIVNFCSADWSKVNAVNSDKLEEISTAVTDFIDALKDCDTDVELAAQDLIDAVVTILGNEENAQSIKSAGKTVIKNFTKGLNNSTKVQELKDAVNGHIKTLKTLITTSDFESPGKSISKALYDGITYYNTTIQSAFSPALSYALSTVWGYYLQFYYAGQNLALGLSRGISSYAYNAAVEAANMAASAVNAARRVLNEHSPSKVFYEIGAYAGEGFVGALDSYSTASYNAGKDMALSARSGLSQAIATVTDLVADGFDTQPTIAPVVDLTNVREGVGTIDSLLSSRRTIGINGNLNAVNSAMSYRNQNATNNDVISAIDSLRKSLQPTGNTYNTINGVTYDDGSNINDAVRALIRAARIERRA